MGPPLEAIEACKCRTDGDVAEFTTLRGDRGKIACEQINGWLIAVPEGDFQGRKASPPIGSLNGQ